jgi:hypothetical protein
VATFLHFDEGALIAVGVHRCNPEAVVCAWLYADDYRFRLFSFLSLRRTVPTSCLVEPRPAIFSQGCGSARDAPGLCDGSIWPKTGCASIV